mgnify:CR=1 FL=1
MPPAYSASTKPGGLRTHTFAADEVAEVVVEDDESLLELINRRIRAIPGVRRTETYMYLTLRKHVYNYGTR